MDKRRSLGVVENMVSTRKTDYLYRISLKCLVRNEKGEILVVKETGRDWWDLPGGGMDHGEDIHSAIAREMQEEVSMIDDFTYRIITIDEPAYLEAHDFWQIRLIFEVKPLTMMFSPGDDGDEVAFKPVETFRDASSFAERQIYTYANLTKND